MHIKKQIRILGIDDSPFEKSDRSVLVVGAVFRGGEYMDCLLTCEIEKDGLNATEKISEMIKKSRNKGQLQYLMFKGNTLGGFNIIDIKKLFKIASLPVLVVMRRKPNLPKIEKALKHFKDKKERIEIIRKAGKIFEYKVSHKELGYKNKKIFFQTAGMEEAEARKILKLTIRHGLIPEPLRIAHIIAHGIKKGESRGRA